MIKLLIVDDEPLVQIGIQSMLDWNSMGIEICSTANNGIQAYDMIQKYSPDIVITDIRMPLMNGLELVRKTRETLGKIPLFLILTSYEEFPLIKEALSYQVIDYLIKLELDSNILTNAITRTLERLDELKPDHTTTLNRPLLQGYHDKFFIRLLHNLFDNKAQFELQKKDLSLEFQADSYLAIHCEIHEEMTQSKTDTQLINLYHSTIQMVRDILNKHMLCYVISLDMKHFAVIFCIAEKNFCQDLILTAIQTAIQMAHNYFNVCIATGIGSSVSQPLLISESYQEARKAFRLTTKNEPITDIRQLHPNSSKNSFNISVFKNDITKAFEEFDTDVLDKILSQIIQLFLEHPFRYIQAIDGASNILYLAISLLPEGETTISEIFSDDPNGYRSLYQLTNVEQIAQWLSVLRDGLCATLQIKRITYKEHAITNVQRYIQNHIDERLTLNDVSAIFGLSPNYLSVLFKKNCNIGFSEYITQMKVNRAKHLLIQSDLKIYEIAEQLGFDNAFYFSKVFKKVVGCSPREYLHKKTVSPNK